MIEGVASAPPIDVRLRMPVLFAELDHAPVDRTRTVFDERFHRVTNLAAIHAWTEDAREYRQRGYRLARSREPVGYFFGRPIHWSWVAGGKRIVAKQLEHRHRVRRDLLVLVD